MAQPVAYNPAFDFSDFQTANPDLPQPGDKLDVEFQAIATTTSQIRTNLAKIQRDDGALANLSVGIDQLKGEVSFGLNAPTNWVTGRGYVVRDGVYQNNNVYICLLPHTSDTFATDLMAGKWMLLLNTGQYVTACANSATSAANSASSATTSAANASTSELNALSSKNAAAASAAAAAALNLPSLVNQAEWRGRNLLDNASFQLWEYGTSFTTSGMTANRWKMNNGGGSTMTVNRVPGSPGDPLFPTDFLMQINRTATVTDDQVYQFVPDVRRTAGKRLSFSISLRAASVNISGALIVVNQYFGTGGSPSAEIQAGQVVIPTITPTGDRKMSLTIDLPSIAGKTIGTNNDHGIRVYIYLPSTLGNIQFFAGDFQVEIGNASTTFERKTTMEEKIRCEAFRQVVGFFRTDYATTTPITYQAGVNYRTRMWKTPTATLAASYANASGFAVSSVGPDFLVGAYTTGTTPGTGTINGAATLDCEP